MSRRVTYLFMVLHAVFASGGYVFGKPAAVQFPSPSALTLARALGAAILLLAMTGTFIPKPKFSRKEWLQIVGLGVLLVPLNQYLFLRGMRDTVPSHPALIYSLTPMCVLVLSGLWARRLPPRAHLLGVLLALGGVMILLRPWESGDVAVLRRGDFAILTSLLVWSTYTVAGRGLMQRHDPRVVTSWSLILGAVMFIPIGFEELATLDTNAIDTRGWIGLAWLIVINSAAMMFLWNAMLARIEPVQVAICANAQPLTTALLAWVLATTGYLATDQDLGLMFWLGAILVIGGATIVQRRARRRGRSA